MQMFVVAYMIEQNAPITPSKYRRIVNAKVAAHFKKNKCKKRKYETSWMLL